MTIKQQIWAWRIYSVKKHRPYIRLKETNTTIIVTVYASKKIQSLTDLMKKEL